ncbi:hypothetical protein Tco_0788946 [Tanacetum coccineum]
MGYLNGINDAIKVTLFDVISNLQVYEVVLEKDSEASKNKEEKYKSLTLKAKKVSSDEEASSSNSENEEHAMAVRDFKKFFRRRGKFVRQPRDDKKGFRKPKEDKKGSDEDENLKKDKICLMAHESNEVHSDTHYYSSSSLDDETWQNEYSKLCKISLKGQADPFEKDLASVSEGIRATIAANTKLKPSLQNRTNFV